MKKILFVCLGNICRSPTAEAVFNKIVSEKRLDQKYECESAGTAAYHVGERPDPRTIEAGQKRGLQFSSVAQQFSEQHFEDFDLIVTMDESNFKNVNRKDPNQNFSDKVFRMVDFLENFDEPEIPDPYYQGTDGFEYVIDLLEDACSELLSKLESKQLQI